MGKKYRVMEVDLFRIPFVDDENDLEYPVAETTSKKKAEAILEKCMRHRNPDSESYYLEEVEV